MLGGLRIARGASVAKNSLRGLSTGQKWGSHTDAGNPIIDTVEERKGKVQPAVAKVMGVDAEYWNRPGPWDEKDLGSLLSANKAWASRMKGQGFFKDATERGHAPKILWIGCSDARVPANEIIGEPPGNVFVHRNIANQVVNTDFNCMSVIQYAVDVLQVKHIIVCGHYDCGGVKAALVNMDHASPLENWLRNIRNIHQNYFDELSGIKDVTARQRRMVEINVVEQCLNIFKTGVVQRRRVKTHLESQDPESIVKFSEPVIHAFVYEPTTGEARKLPVNFKKYMETYSDVFNLYDTKSATDSGPGSTHKIEMQDSAPSVDSSGNKPLSHKKAWDNSDRPALGTRPSVSQILRESLQEEGNLPK